MIRKLAVLAILILTAGAWLAAAEDPSPVKIMTQNMDNGTDLGYIVALLGTNPQLAVDSTLDEIKASDIPGRAEILAAQIAAGKPHLVGLQEVSLWRTGPAPESADTVLYDQLQLLLTALARRGVPYEVVTVNSLIDLALPGSTGAVRFTDRDAMLVRADLRPPAFSISDAKAHLFNATFKFSGLAIPSGWISADVHSGGKQFRFVTTHLQSPVPGARQATLVQIAQTGELIWALRGSGVPVVVGGDFNSDADFGRGPDATPSAAILQVAGYADTWRVANRFTPGKTWPLFLEDQTPPNYTTPSVPFERIDLFFSKGIRAVSDERVSASAPPYASDHTGVVAVFQP